MVELLSKIYNVNVNLRNYAKQGNERPTISRLFNSFLPFSIIQKLVLMLKDYSGDYTDLLDIAPNAAESGQFEFGSDGTKFYMCAYKSNFEFDLLTPYDLTTATLNFNRPAVDTSLVYQNKVCSIAHDGSVFFNTDTLGRLKAYTLNTPFSLGAVSTTKHVYLDTLIGTPTSNSWNSIRFNITGTKMFALNSYQMKIYVFNFSTPWDIDTISYDDEYFDIRSYSNSANCTMIVSNDGTKLILTGLYDSTQYKWMYYQFSLNSAWSLSVTPTLEHTVDCPSSALRYGLFNGTESKFILMDSASVKIYDLASPGTLVGSSLSSPTEIPNFLGSYTFSYNSFSEDGTKLYMLNDYEVLRQIDLATPWDIRTGQMAVDKYFKLPASSYYGLDFKPDGTCFFVVNPNIRAIEKYTLSTPWDITTASLDSQSDALLTTSMKYIEFSPDGSKFVVFDNPFLYEVTLDTPWDITNVTITNKAPVYTGAENNEGLFFYNDGSNVIIIDYNPCVVMTLSLSTPYDLSTASYVNSQDIRSTIPYCTSVYMKTDGTKLFIDDGQSKKIHQFTLTTPWDITTLNYVNFFSSTAFAPNQSAIWFKDDGSKIYVSLMTPVIFEVPLTTPWDITTVDTVSSQQIVLTGMGSGSLVDFCIINNGSTLVTLGSDYRLHEYSIATPWDITTINNVPIKDVYHSGTPLTATSVITHDVGGGIDEIYVLDSVYDAVSQYSLSTKSDISSISLTGVSPKVDVGRYQQGLTFNPTGTKLYYIEKDTLKLYEHTLSTPWNVNTMSVDSTYQLDISANFSIGGELVFNNDGTKLIISEYTNSTTTTLGTYNLSTGWDLSTASFGSSYNTVSSLNTITTNVRFNSTGTIMYLIHSGSIPPQFIRQFTLSTAWDVSTAAFSGKELTLQLRGSTVNRFDFNSDGTELLVILYSNFMKYELSTAWDISTAVLTFNDSLYMGTKDSGRRFVFANNGQLLIVAGSNGNCCAFNLSTPYDINTISIMNGGDYDNEILNKGIVKNQFSDMKSVGNGTLLWCIDNGSYRGRIVEFALSNGFSVNNLREVDSMYLGDDSTRTGLIVSEDAGDIYVGIGNGQYKVFSK